MTETNPAAAETRATAQAGRSDGAPSKKADVAIVGGGMVGTTLALLLSELFGELGLDKRIVLIEPGDFQLENPKPWSPSFDDRSTALSAGTLNVLRELHFWESLTPNLSSIRKVKVSDRGHLGFSQFSSEDNQGENLGAVIENACLGQVLLKACNDSSDIEILGKTQAKKLIPQANAMALELLGGDGKQKPTEIVADLVVLADGALSSLASSLGVQFDKHNYSQRALIANVTHAKAHNGVAFECFSEQGPLALLPLNDFQGQHRSALVWTHPDEIGERMQALDKTHFVQALQKQFGYRLGRILSVGDISSFPLNLYVANEQVRSSLVLMGNAAHFLHPVAGQGFNLAIRDCVELCRQIELGVNSGKRLGDLRVLQAYLDARKNDQLITTEASHSFIKMFASDQPLKQVSRNLGLLAMHKIDPVRSYFFQQMMGKHAR